MPFIDRPGATIFYETWGDGDGHWVTLINGHTRTTSDFRMLARHLAGRGFRVLSCDNRGSGQSEVSRDFQLPEMVDDIIAVWDAEGIQKSHVLGISMGGMIAQWLSSHFPARVGRLVLVSTCPNRDFINDHGSYEWSGHQDAVQAKLARYFSSRFLAANQPLVNAMAKQMAQAAASGGPFLMNAGRQMKAMQGFDATSHLGQITAPTLIIHGAEDAIVPVSAGRILANGIYGAKLKEVPAAGHLLIAEIPSQLYELVSGHLV
ncbi:MAG: 3-oxoadipate enol-lactonase [Pseudomonadota bacterium]